MVVQVLSLKMRGWEDGNGDTPAATGWMQRGTVVSAYLAAGAEEVSFVSRQQVPRMPWT